MNWILLFLPVTIILFLLVILLAANRNSKESSQLIVFDGIRQDKLATHIPFVIQNYSGFTEDEVFIAAVDAKNLIDLNQTSTILHIPIDQTRYEEELSTYHLGNTDVCTPMGEGEYMIYVPKTLSGKIYISYRSPLVFTVNSAGEKAEPSPVSSTDASYNTVYSFMEYTYNNVETLYANVSAVDMMGLPMHLSLVQNHETLASSGLYIPRSYIIAHARTRFGTSNWKELIKATNDDELDNCSRIMSPKLHLSDNPNDKFIQWNNHLTNDVTFKVQCGNSNPGLKIFPSTWECTLKINEKTLTIVHTGPPPIEEYHDVFVVDVSELTEYIILGAQTIPSNWVTEQTELIVKWKNDWADAPINQCFKALSQNVQIGHFPPIDDTVITVSSHDYYKQIESKYYTGDMYDLYSRTIHECSGIDGGLYTYAYDEPLFPNVLGAVANWKSDTSSYMTLYLGHSRKIPDIYTTIELSEDDTFTPLKSGTFKMPSFKQLDENEYYHFARPPMKSNILSTMN